MSSRGVLSVVVKTPKCPSHLGIGLVLRMVPAESGVDLHRLNLGLFSSAEEERIVKAAGVLSDLPVWIDETWTGDAGDAQQGPPPFHGAWTGPDRRRLPAARVGQPPRPGAGEQDHGDQRDLPIPEGPGW